MSEHFLLSRLARDLPVTEGEPSCPHCGVTKCYGLTRRRFKCSGCRKEFTVTSGTIFASRKLPFRQILAIIALSANGAKGKAALELCREIGVQYKTAWATLMKLREALAARARTSSSRERSRSTGSMPSGTSVPRTVRRIWSIAAAPRTNRPTEWL